MLLILLEYTGKQGQTQELSCAGGSIQVTPSKLITKFKLKTLFMIWKYSKNWEILPLRNTKGFGMN